MQSLAVTAEFPSSLEQRVGWQTYTRHHSSKQRTARAAVPLWSWESSCWLLCRPDDADVSEDVWGDLSYYLTLSLLTCSYLHIQSGWKWKSVQKPSRWLGEWVLLQHETTGSSRDSTSLGISDKTSSNKPPSVPQTLYSACTHWFYITNTQSRSDWKYQAQASLELFRGRQAPKKFVIAPLIVSLEKGLITVSFSIIFWHCFLMLYFANSSTGDRTE